MTRVFSYIVKRDYGFAPNPFYGTLTLATCKPRIRKLANVGDFIIGNATASEENKLIFMAKISEVMTFDTYWTSPLFQPKKPVMNGSLKKLYGDNIYHHDQNGTWIQENSHHSLADGSVNTDNLHRDTSTTDRVLICKDFFYFGKSMFHVPKEYTSCIHKWIGHHCPDFSIAQKLWNYLKTHYPDGGKIDQPKLFEHFKRYDGKS